MKDVSSDNR